MFRQVSEPKAAVSTTWAASGAATRSGSANRTRDAGSVLTGARRDGGGPAMLGGSVRMRDEYAPADAEQTCGAAWPRLVRWYNLSYTHGVKTAISIPDSIFQSADALAKQLGISRSELYAKAVAEYLSRHQGEQITARLDAIHGQEDSRVEPALGQPQARAPPREALW